VDTELVVRAQGGDRDAFARVAAAAISRLDTLARLITRDTELAKDAVQECLVKAWRDLPALREPARFDAWLRQLLVRACIDELRRKRRRAFEIELTDGHHPTIGDSAVAFADRDALARGFRRLDPQQRAFVVMHYYLGLPVVEIAESVGVPVGTAKATLHRARVALRAALEADARPGVGFQESRA